MSLSLRVLRLYLHSPDLQKIPIGYISSFGDLVRISFDENYINHPNRLVVSQAYQAFKKGDSEAILRSEKDIRLVRNDAKLPVFFQNLLPEGHNLQRLARERQCGTDDQFELLAAAGHDLMGAIEVAPLSRLETIPDNMLIWHTTMSKDSIDPGFVESPLEDGAAIPGVVVKFSAIQEGRRYVIHRHGLAGSYILKLPSQTHPDLVENEATGYALLKALGIKCANAKIISSSEVDLPDLVPFPHILAVQRFDRGDNGKRIHMEDFAQILQYAPQHKYGKDLLQDYSAMLLILDQLSSQPVKDCDEFVKRFVAYLLMGNTDAHLKNWAVIYPNGRELQLSPAYDPVCVSSFFDEVPKHHYGLNRAIDTKLVNFSWSDLNHLFELAKMKRKNQLLKIAKETVMQAQQVWPEILNEAPLSVRNCILARLQGGVSLTRQISH